jgi:hypothetical protein
VRSTIARVRSVVPVLVCVFVAVLPTFARGATPTFTAPVRTPIGGTEPGIDIADDGTVFVNAPAGLGIHSGLARSVDGGAHFKALGFPTPYTRFPGGGDSDVALAPGGRVYFLDLWAGSNSLTVSQDNGETWTSGTPFTTLPLTDRQWIEVGSRDAEGKDTVYVAYQTIQPPSALTFSRSRDGGLVWDHHTLPVGTVDALPGQIVADGEFVAISYLPQGTGQLWVTWSDDAGTTWHNARADEDGHVAQQIFSFSGLALDGQHLYASYVDRTTNTINVLHSPDRGVSWDPAVVVSSPTGTSTFPWVAARAGKAAVAWYSTPAAGPPGDMPPTTSWSVSYAETLDRGATYSTPVVAAPNVKTGPICTNGTLCQSGRELGDFLQLAIDASQRSLITYIRIGAPYVVRQV